MPCRCVVVCLVFLPQAFASEDLSWIELRLQRLLAITGYQQAFCRQVDQAFLNLPKPSRKDEADASARVQAALVRYADRSMALRFVEVAGPPWGMTAQVYGSRIVVNAFWLREAREDDVHAALAHEVAHDANDCIRFWLIEESALTKRQKENARNEIEMKVDARAIDLLRRENRGTGVLPDMLSRYLPPGPASKARIEAARNASRTQ